MRGRQSKRKKEKSQRRRLRQTRVTWLGLGEEWGVVRDVRRMIYKLLTPLERATVEKAHGVEWAFERTKWAVCRWAAQKGYLEVLQWARANGCPWDEEVCTFAARGGRLEVLQWARANG